MPVLLVLWFPGRITEVILNHSFIQVSDYVFYHVSTFFSCLCFFTSWLAIIVIIKCQTTFRSHSFVMLRLSIYDLTVFFFLLLCHPWFSSFIYQPYIHIINIMHIPLIQWLLLIRNLYHRFIYVYKNRLCMPTPLILNPHIAASTEITHTPPHLR